MKILWMCNLILPQIAEEMKTSVPYGGGWMTGLAEDIISATDIELTVCFPYRTAVEGTAGKIRYFGFDGETAIHNIIEKENPDIVHIFGTEYMHSYHAAMACEKLGMSQKAVVSAQGIVSFASKHYFGGIPTFVKYARTLRDVLKRQSINKAKKSFEKRGIFERKTLKAVQHVIGRTDWDYACTRLINPDIKYHFCNETLRKSFYEKSWDIEKCEKYSIFASQCNYPLKGFHRVLEAMQIVKQVYPDAKLYTTGRNLINKKGFISEIKLTYYEMYLKKIIKKYNLEKNVVFLGQLDEQAMCDRYLKSHVFVSASSIENSPNSLGEAMILGVPTVTSDVGGVKALFKHNEDGFIYQADAPYMLADCIIKIFESNELARVFSENARKHGNVIHNKKTNLETMIKIYEAINES